MTDPIAKKKTDCARFWICQHKIGDTVVINVSDRNRIRIAADWDGRNLRFPES